MHLDGQSTWVIGLLLPPLLLPLMPLMLMTIASYCCAACTRRRRRRRRLRCFWCLAGCIECCACRPTGSKDGLVKLWCPRSGRNLSTLHGHKGTIMQASSAGLAGQACDANRRLQPATLVGLPPPLWFAPAACLLVAACSCLCTRVPAPYTPCLPHLPASPCPC